MRQFNIQDMLQCIPSIFPGGLDSYFDSMDSNLSVYENLNYAPTLLALAMWKSNFAKQTDGDIDLLNANMKMECHTYSLLMVTSIDPNELYFL